MNTRLSGWEATSRPALGGLEVTAAGGLPRGAVSILEADRWLGRHQLFCNRMRFRRAHPPVHGHGRGGRAPTPPPAPAARPVSATVQLKPFRTRRGVARSDAGRHTDLANPWLIWAHNGPSPERGSWLDPSGSASRSGGAWSSCCPAAPRATPSIRGWPWALRTTDSPVERVGEVLEEMVVLVDDRRLASEAWPERRLEGLAQA